jgi:hypothetical protein
MNTSSGLISGTPTTASPATTYTVTVSDSASPTASSETAPFSLHVIGQLNVGTMVTGRSFTKGSAISAFYPNTNTAAGGVTPYTYSISPALPAGLTLNTTSALISGTPTTGSALTTYTLTITDTAITGYVRQTNSDTFDMKVLVPFSVSQTVATTVVITGSAASFTPVSAAGGTSPYTYSISPALPTGLSMNTSSGLISGTPTTVTAAATYTVTVTDSTSPQNSGTATFSLRTVQQLSIGTMVTGRSFTKGSAISAFYPNTNTAAGGVIPYTYSISPALPAGLTMSTSTGLISGTPTVHSALTTYTLTITDTAITGYVRQIVTDTFDLRVIGITVTPVISGTPTLTFTKLVAIPANTVTVTITSTGTTNPLIYSISPALPSGVTFSTTTGQISGTFPATLTASTYTITVKDSSSPQISSTATITITVLK